MTEKNISLDLIEAKSKLYSNIIENAPLEVHTPTFFIDSKTEQFLVFEKLVLKLKLQYFPFFSFKIRTWLESILENNKDIAEHSLILNGWPGCSESPLYFHYEKLCSRFGTYTSYPVDQIVIDDHYYEKKTNGTVCSNTDLGLFYIYSSKENDIVYYAICSTCCFVESLYCALLNFDKERINQKQTHDFGYSDAKSFFLESGGFFCPAARIPELRNQKVSEIIMMDTFNFNGLFVNQENTVIGDNRQILLGNFTITVDNLDGYEEWYKSLTSYVQDPSNTLKKIECIKRSRIWANSIRKVLPPEIDLFCGYMTVGLYDRKYLQIPRIVPYKYNYITRQSTPIPSRIKEQERPMGQILDAIQNIIGDYSYIHELPLRSINLRLSSIFNASNFIFNRMAQRETIRICEALMSMIENCYDDEDNPVSFENLSLEDADDHQFNYLYLKEVVSSITNQLDTIKNLAFWDFYVNEFPSLYNTYISEYVEKRKRGVETYDFSDDIETRDDYYIIEDEEECPISCSESVESSFYELKFSEFDLEILNEDDKSEAFACLNNIVSACEEIKMMHSRTCFIKQHYLEENNSQMRLGMIADIIRVYENMKQFDKYVTGKSLPFIHIFKAANELLNRKRKDKWQILEINIIWVLAHDFMPLLSKAIKDKFPNIPMPMQICFD